MSQGISSGAPVFSDGFERQIAELRPQHRLPRAVRHLLAVLLLGISAIIWCLAPQFAYRGRIVDLPQQEKTLLQRLKEQDVFVEEAQLPCTMAAHAVVAIRWLPDERAYCVDSIEFWAAKELDSIVPVLREFKGLRSVFLPTKSTADIAWLQLALPHLHVRGEK